jgi:hypothetical protein
MRTSWFPRGIAHTTPWPSLQYNEAGTWFDWPGGQLRPWHEIVFGRVAAWVYTETIHFQSTASAKEGGPVTGALHNSTAQACNLHRLHGSMSPLRDVTRDFGKGYFSAGVSVRLSPTQPGAQACFAQWQLLKPISAGYRLQTKT